MSSSSTIRQKTSKDRAAKARRPGPITRFTQAVFKITGGTLLSVAMVGSSAIAGGLVGLAISFRNLPDVRVLQDYVPTETSYFYDVNGKLLASVHDEANREVVPLNKISPHLKRAVLAIEDSHFYIHSGIDPRAVGRALLVNVESGGTVEGASTLTMQLVKNLFLTPQRTLSRKIAESVLSIRLEQILQKDEILEMYLNQVYWGHNTYGIQTAADSYFGKSADQLTLAESAMLAGLIKAPEEYSPFTDYKKSKVRQSIVLSRMRELDWITAEEEAAARKQPLRLAKITSFQQSQVPYVTDAAIQELTKRFNRDAVLKGGMRVQTTIDLKLQRIAESTVRSEYQKLRGRGLYADQIALVAVDPRTHFVKAMVGGVDYGKSQFNRVLNSQRQPGSSFKPFVYYTAFATGKYTPNSIVNDSPVSYPDGYKRYYPKNYDGSFSGPMSIRGALEQSRNVPAIKLGQAVGLDKVIENCRAIGINSPLDQVVSLPLGAVGVTPLEMAGAYATFASNGWYSQTTFILQVTDSKGNVLLDNTPEPQLVLEPWAAASLNSVLQGVVTRGTGKAAQIGRPAAGKTGTTNSERDIWFVGYVPQLATAVWVGNDDYRPLGKGATGGGFVAPIWRSFMQQALKGVPVEKFRPASDFAKPSS